MRIRGARVWFSLNSLRIVAGSCCFSPYDSISMIPIAIYLFLLLLFCDLIWLLYPLESTSFISILVLVPIDIIVY